MEQPGAAASSVVASGVVGGGGLVEISLDESVPESPAMGADPGFRQRPSTQENPFPSGSHTAFEAQTTSQDRTSDAQPPAFDVVHSATTVVALQSSLVPQARVQTPQRQVRPAPQRAEQSCKKCDSLSPPDTGVLQA